MENEDNNEGSVWNFDESEYKLIFGLKLTFIDKREKWDLEGAYWALFNLLTESEAILNETKREELNSIFEEISKYRKKFANGFNDLDEQEKTNCWQALNEFYRIVCLGLVGEGVYFRKKEGYEGL